MSSLELQIWDAASPDDARAWLDHWKRWPRREVFAHPHYAALETSVRIRVLCAAVESDELNVMYPFILRDLTSEPYCPQGLAAAADIISPYGYGGPFYWGNANPSAAAHFFWRAFDDWARQQIVVSEFVRLPLFPEEILPYPGTVRERAGNVVRELDLAEDEFWMNFEHKVRKNVKKALRNDVRIELDPTGERLDDFIRLYASTMDRRQANAYYYFQKSYFEAICQDLAGSFMFFHAIHDQTVVSTELVLVSAENVYSFLGGTERTSFELCPNDLVKYEVIRWAKHQGKKRFILGGGHQPDDGIFRYKLSFAPQGRKPFWTGQRILRNDLYEQLVDSRRSQAHADGIAWSPQPDFFPCYRA